MLSTFACDHDLEVVVLFLYNPSFTLEKRPNQVPTMRNMTTSAPVLTVQIVLYCLPRSIPTSNRKCVSVIYQR